MKIVSILLITLSIIKLTFAQTNFDANRHIDVAFTSTQFDDLMKDLNTRMQLANTHDCPNDIPCTAKFQRNGNIGTFGVTGDGLNNLNTPR